MELMEEDQGLELCSDDYLATTHYISTALFTIFTILPCINGIYSFCQNRNTVHPIFLISFIIVCLFNGIVNIASGLSVYGCYYYSNIFQRITRMIGFGLYVTLICIALLIIIFRLDLSFKGTPFQVNYKIIRCYNILIFILLITMVPSVSLAIWYSNKQKHDTIYKISTLFGALMCMYIYIMYSKLKYIRYSIYFRFMLYYIIWNSY